MQRQVFAAQGALRSLHCKCVFGVIAIFHQAVIGGWNNMARGKILSKAKCVRLPQCGLAACNPGSACRSRFRGKVKKRFEERRSQCAMPDSRAEIWSSAGTLTPSFR